MTEIPWSALYRPRRFLVGQWTGGLSSATGPCLREHLAEPVVGGVLDQDRDVLAVGVRMKKSFGNANDSPHIGGIDVIESNRKLSYHPCDGVLFRIRSHP